MEIISLVLASVAIIVSIASVIINIRKEDLRFKRQNKLLLIKEYQINYRTYIEKLNNLELKHMKPTIENIKILLGKGSDLLDMNTLILDLSYEVSYLDKKYISTAEKVIDENTKSNNRNKKINKKYPSIDVIEKNKEEYYKIYMNHLYKHKDSLEEMLRLVARDLIDIKTKIMLAIK